MAVKGGPTWNKGKREGNSICELWGGNTIGILPSNYERVGFRLILIDKEDLPKVKDYTWRVHIGATGTYAVSTSKTLKIHHFIMGKGIDHINRNGLDNRKSNLRFCTRSQNMANRRIFKSKSGLKGVYIRESGRFSAHIRVNGKDKHIGTFDTLEEAGRAYNKAALQAFGEFAIINREVEYE